MAAETMDAVDAVRGGMARGGEGAAEALAVLAGRLERVRHLGGRFALVDVSPEVAGMLKAVGRLKLTC